MKNEGQLCAKTIGISILLFWLSCSLGNAYANDQDQLPIQKLNKSLSEKQAIEELDLVRDIIVFMHPASIVNTNRAKIDQKVKELRRTIKTKSDASFAYLRYAKMLSLLCDGHTGVSFIDDDNRDLPSAIIRTAPDYFVEIKDQLLSLGPTRRSHKFWSIESMDNIRAEQIIDYLKEHASLDGCASSQTLSTASDNVDELLTLLFASKQRYAVRYRNPSDRTQVLTISSRARHIGQYRQDIIRQRSSSKEDLIKLGFNGFRKHGDNLYAVEQKRDLAYLKIPTFNEGSKEFRKKIKPLMRRLIRENPRSLILDLRFNPGGFVDNAGYLASYLLPRSHRMATEIVIRQKKIPHGKYFTWTSPFKEKVIQRTRAIASFGKRNGLYRARVKKRSYGNPHYKGKIYVLINQGTASAAALLANVLDLDRDAILVGQGAGSSGTFSCFAPSGFYTLPYSKLRLHVPQTCYFGSGYKQKGNARLIPDLPVEMTPKTIEDLPSLTLEAAIADARER